jgi:selenocysteine-specific elongation factor
VVARLPYERRGSKLYRPGAAAGLGARAGDADALEAAVAAAAPGTAKVADPDLARHLEREGRLVRLGAEHAVAPAVYERARELVAAECAAAGSISLARFRDLAGCGRRDAQLLLERLDADGVTRRAGDARVLRRSASRSA